MKKIGLAVLCALLATSPAWAAGGKDEKKSSSNSSSSSNTSKYDPSKYRSGPDYSKNTVKPPLPPKLRPKNNDNANNNYAKPETNNNANNNYAKPETNNNANNNYAKPGNNNAANSTGNINEPAGRNRSGAISNPSNAPTIPRNNNNASRNPMPGTVIPHGPAPRPPAKPADNIAADGRQLDPQNSPPNSPRRIIRDGE